MATAILCHTETPPLLEAGAGQGQGEHLQGETDRTGYGAQEAMAEQVVQPDPYTPPKKFLGGTYGLNIEH